VSVQAWFWRIWTTTQPLAAAADSMPMSSSWALLLPPTHKSASRQHIDAEHCCCLPHTQVDAKILRAAWESSQRVTREDWSEWQRHFAVELLRTSPSPALRACHGLAQVSAPHLHPLPHVNVAAPAALPRACWLVDMLLPRTCLQNWHPGAVQSTARQAGLVISSTCILSPPHHVPQHCCHTDHHALSPPPQVHPTMARELFAAGFVSCWSELDPGLQEALVRSLEAALAAPTIPPETVTALLNLAEFMEHDDKRLPLDTRTLGELLGHA
jgi:hypothetical protein